MGLFLPLLFMPTPLPICTPIGAQFVHLLYSFVRASVRAPIRASIRAFIPAPIRAPTRVPIHIHAFTANLS